MKRLSAFLLALCIFLHALCAEQKFSMDEIFSSLTESSVTTGNFVQGKMSSKLKRPLKSSGKFIICSQGVVWKTEKPFPSVMTVTESYMIQTRPDGSKNVIDGSQNEVFKSIAQSLSAIFTGTKSELEKSFNIESFFSSENFWSLSLTPKDSTISAALKKIDLQGAVNSSKKASMDLIVISQGEGESTSYKMSEQNYKTELSDEEKLFFKK